MHESVRKWVKTTYLLLQLALGPLLLLTLRGVGRGNGLGLLRFDLSLGGLCLIERWGQETRGK